MLIKILFFVYRQYKSLDEKIRIFCYKFSGGKPWTMGYHEFKWQFIQQVINNRKLINKFKMRKRLPKRYGSRIDERIVEYPWFIANLPTGQGKLLDAGSTLNYRTILEDKKLENKSIYIVNLKPESRCFWQKGVSYLFTDLRKLPFLDNYFDLITCISTLEHIGMDNTMIYIKDKKYEENKTRDYLKVIKEFRRVLKPKGQLLVTLPFGQYQNCQFLQQFNKEMIKQIIKTFKPKDLSIAYYKYSKDGWNVSKEEKCQEMKYFNIHQRKDYDADFAAAARAVACLKLIK